MLSNNLVDAEQFKRENKIQKSLDQYKIISNQFENELLDYETASYFYKRCLDISQEFKSTPGEANAYMGLGICEEKVCNIDMARENLETALEKAIESRLDRIVPSVQKQLIRVYKVIAEQALSEQEDFDRALEYFNKCLGVSKDAKVQQEEADCYQRIGLIYKKQNDLEQATFYLNKFLKICEEMSNKEMQGEAHKQLADTYSASGNITQAIQHLQSLLAIANESGKKSANADAALKLGLLHYKEGYLKKSVEFLGRHFELARTGDEKNQAMIDMSRVNLGIADANTKIEQYKKLVLNDTQSLLTWKVKREFKKN